MAGQVGRPKPVTPHLDPTSNNFTSSRHLESLNTAFSAFGFAQADAGQQRPDTGATSWPDATSVHSPNEDRRSVTNSDYMSPSSGAPSRSGSLPPSRHGAEPAQYHQPREGLSRFSQPASRHGSSFSVAQTRPLQERSGSIQSDSYYPLNRPFHDQDREPRLAAHRPSTNGFAPSFTPSQESATLRDSYPDAQLLGRTERTGQRSLSTYTPENYTASQVGDPSAQLRAFQFDSRSAPNGTGVRPGPFYSHQSTPPPVYDHLNPYRSEQPLSHPHNFAQVQNKLASYQTQQQERRNFIPPSQLHQQPLQPILPAHQLRPPYGYQVAVPNGMQLTVIPAHMAMGAMAPMMMPLQHPPRGPRDQQASDGLGTMSETLVAFKRESKQNKRWELPDIYGYVVEFAGDQHGSRFIQQKLETANSEVKERIFTALQGEALQLMQDVFGNYVIQKFFEHGDQTQKKILVGKMRGHVLALANQMYACRVVQKALEHALTDQQIDMVKELEKDVIRTVKDQNGNHVIQKIIDRVPMEHIQNIVEAFRGNVGTLSIHTYGCRVIQRLLEKVPEPRRRFILAELHAEGPKLITDSYGNYVIQHVIEHGLPEDRARIVGLIKAQFLNYSRHKFASNVVEQCLICGDDEQRRELVTTVTAKNERAENTILTLLRDGYGNYVIQKLLETLGREDYEMFLVELKPELDKARKMITGKQIVSVEKKMYRYDRVDSPTMPPPTPGLTSSADSPQSSIPSTNTSTIDEPIHDKKRQAGGTHGGVEVHSSSS